MHHIQGNSDIFYKKHRYLIICLFCLWFNKNFSAVVARTFGSWSSGGSTRRGRMMNQMPTMAPSLTQSVLLKAYGAANEDVDVHGGRHGK